MPGNYKNTRIYIISSPTNEDVFIHFTNRKDGRLYQASNNLYGRQYLHPRLKSLNNDFYKKVKFIKKYPCKTLKEVKEEIERICLNYPTNINNLVKTKKMGRKKKLPEIKV